MKKIFLSAFFVLYLFGIELHIPDSLVFQHPEKLSYEDLTKPLSLEEKITLELLLAIKEHRHKDEELLASLLRKTDIPKNPFDNILLAPPGQWSIVVEKSKQRLYVVNGTKIHKLPCITGKKPGDKLKQGDQKTPDGIYFPKTFIAPKSLTPIYGEGAFPLNYPNIIDKKIHHKTGNGIWLHATNDDNRKPFSSNGCVVVTNEIFTSIKPIIKLKETPVIVVDNVDPIDPESFYKERLSLGYFIYRWKKAWEGSVNGKYKRYMDFYSDRLICTYGDKKAFMAHKKAIAQNKKWIKIDIEDLYLAKDGRLLDFGHLYVASFKLAYDSNNYKWSGRKILYIIKKDGQWKILAEENL